MYTPMMKGLLTFKAQSFHVDYAALGLQPKRTPLRVAKRKDMHRDCNDCNTGKARAAVIR